MNSFEEVLAESAAWSEATFPHSTVDSILTHLAREVEELRKNPHDASEGADVQMLLAHWAYRTRTDMASAVKAKLEVNRQRQWGPVDSEGVVEHVREEEPKHIVHYMKIDSNGNPYGIGHAEQNTPSHHFVAPDGETFAMDSLSKAVKENWQELAKQKKDHWEPVTRSDGVKGRVFIYYKNGRIFAKEPEYDTE